MNDQPRWLNVFNDVSTSSFIDVLRREQPHLLAEARLSADDLATVPHGTTVLCEPIPSLANQGWAG